MNRVKIKFPDENPLFSTSVKIRIGDINYGGHVGNDSILSVIHEARVQMLAQWGYTETTIEHLGLIMADVMIAYRGESFYGDVLSIDIYATEVTEKSFDLLYKLTTERDGRTTDIAHAKTGMLCFDYNLRKIAPMPEVLKSRLKNL